MKLGTGGDENQVCYFIWPKGELDEALLWTMLTRPRTEGGSLSTPLVLALAWLRH